MKAITYGHSKFYVVSLWFMYPYFTTPSQQRFSNIMHLIDTDLFETTITKQKIERILILVKWFSYSIHISEISIFKDFIWINIGYFCFVLNYIIIYISHNLRICTILMSYIYFSKLFLKFFFISNAYFV